MATVFSILASYKLGPLLLRQHDVDQSASRVRCHNCLDPGDDTTGDTDGISTDRKADTP